MSMQRTVLHCNVCTCPCLSAGRKTGVVPVPVKQGSHGQPLQEPGLHTCIKKIISYDFRHSSPSPPIVEIVQIKQKKKTRKTELLKGKLEDLDI